MTTPDLTDAREIADYLDGSMGCWHSGAAPMLRALADRCVEQDAELERLRAQAVPAGWRLVPVEPTPEMIAATASAPVNYPAFCWAAMLAASPAAPAQQAPAAGNVATDDATDIAAIRDAWLRANAPERLRTTEQTSGSSAAAPVAGQYSTVGGEPAELDEDPFEPWYQRWLATKAAHMSLRATAWDAFQAGRGFPVQSAAQAEPVAKVCPDLPGSIGWNPRLTSLPDEGTDLYAAPQHAQAEPVARVIFNRTRKKPDVEWLIDEVQRGMLLYAAPPSNPAAQGIDAAVAAERERCARIVERINEWLGVREVAAEIRGQTHVLKPDKAPAAAPLTDEQEQVIDAFVTTITHSYQSAFGIGAAKELDAWQCDHCGGEGWTWQPRQVAERATDVQQVKIHCDECGGTGWQGPDAAKAAAKEQQ